MNFEEMDRADKGKLKRLVAQAQLAIVHAMRRFSQKEKKHVKAGIDALRTLHVFLQKQQTVWRQLMVMLRDAAEAVLHIVGIPSENPGEVTMKDLRAAGELCRCISAELEFA